MFSGAKFPSLGLILLLVQFFPPALPQSPGDVRLAGSQPKTSHLGRVEVFFEGRWGTICDMNYAGAADVICYQLNQTLNSLHYPGTSVSLMNEVLQSEMKGVLQIERASNDTPILLRDVDCGAVYSDPLGTVHILRCDYERMRPDMLTECTHEHDLAVYCEEGAGRPMSTYDSQVRLVGGQFPSEGTLELFRSLEPGGWGNICSRGFDKSAGDAVCRQLGYTHIEKVLKTQEETTKGVAWSGKIFCDKPSPCLRFCLNKEAPIQRETSCPHDSYVQLQCGFDTSSNTTSGNPIMCSKRKSYSKTPGYFVAIMSGSGLLWTVLTAAVIVSATCYSVKRCPVYRLRKVEHDVLHSIHY